MDFFFLSLDRRRIIICSISKAWSAIFLTAVIGIHQCVKFYLYGFEERWRDAVTCHKCFQIARFSESTDT